MKKQRLTKTLIAQHMRQIARNPDLAILQAGAALLDRPIIPGEGDTFFYTRELYHDFAALQDTLLLDLGNASRSLYNKSEVPASSSESRMNTTTQDEEELERLERQIKRMWLTLKAAQADLEAAQAKLRELEFAHQEALREFAERGYRDITQVVKPVYEQDGEYPFLCTLFSPDGIAVYCRDGQQRQEALLKARTMYHLGTAAYPRDPELWQVIGNFDEEVAPR